MRPSRKAGLLHPRTYKRIYGHVPLVCVDVLVLHDTEVLLARRAHEPARGQWFPPGGRVYKNESLKRAVRRKMLEELGLKIAPAQLTLLTVGETIFRGPRSGASKHTVNIVYAVRLAVRPPIAPDPRHHSAVGWFSRVAPSWHPYVKAIVRRALVSPDGIS